jgi:hypothetical protein
MLNPLSLQVGQEITGKEINDWCLYQIKNNGSHYKQAKYLLTKNYKDDRVYCKSYKIETSGSAQPYIIEFNKIRR